MKVLLIQPNYNLESNSQMAYTYVPYNFCILGAMMMGFIWGLIPGVLKAYLGANELVATLMLNTVAIKFYEGGHVFLIQDKQAFKDIIEWLTKIDG